MIRYISLCLGLGLVLVFSCAPKQTKLILLPQDNGDIGAVTLNTGKETMVLDKPYTISRSGKSGVEKVDPELIKKTYEQLFKAELKRPKAPSPPLPPEIQPTKYILYFQGNSILLTQKSKAKLPDILTYIKTHPPSKIRILGYADSLGNNKSNLELSQNRANWVSKQIITEDTVSFQLEVRGYGEHGLAVQPPDETPEPKNRQVTIWIE